MKTKIFVKNLKKGMFVLLPKEADKFFSKREFLIDNEEQLIKIQSTFEDRIEIDVSKSFKENLFYPLSNEDLEEKMQNSKSEERAKIIYSQTIEIMKSFFEKIPSNESLIKTKKDIETSVSYIIENDDMDDFFIKIKEHDSYTYTHSVNVGIFAVMLAKRLYRGKKEHNLLELGSGFFLHDLGKVMVDSSIINKKGKLTKEEFGKMKTHPYQGYKLLEKSNQLTKEAGIIVMQHHERCDGKGYPRQLKCEKIHEYAKICTISDVFDALTAKRSYKEAMSPFKALDIMRNEMLDFFEKEMFEIL
jgi:HD-GYP domain-containing protein (c-di-GMP phosphodiesterase class II)